MDKVKAKDWEKRLVGTSVSDWKIDSLIDFGKSAAVFRAHQGKQQVALKLFDDELIERYGDAVQLKRIERELTLVGKHHPSMVKILDGGFDAITKNHFIVMEYLDGPNLRKALEKIPDDNVPALVEQLASACEFLETLDLAHRDIKPENIILTGDLDHLVLLDFGVLKPVGEEGVTDADGVQSFVGTLQYSSPEYLLRKEVDSTEGWRALTFYQIGGVIHDLIMRRPLFEEFANPYARLVNAVQHDTPRIESSTAPVYLVEAAKSALTKDPQTRLKLLDWDSFKPPLPEQAQISAKDRVIQRSLRLRAEQLPKPKSDARAGELRDVAIRLLKLELRKIRASNTGGIPPLVVAPLSRNSNVLRVQLRPSDELELAKGITIFLEVEMLDPAAQAVCLNASAHVGQISERPKAAKRARVFQGIIPAPALSSALEGCVYVAIDQAQQGKSNLSFSDLEVG